jgi:hypothetical protein
MIWILSNSGEFMCDVGQYLSTSLKKTKRRKRTKLIWKQCQLIRMLAIVKQWKYKRKSLKVNSMSIELSALIGMKRSWLKGPMKTKAKGHTCCLVELADKGVDEKKILKYPSFKNVEISKNM